MEISGVVQGVGFRPFLKKLALRHNMDGYCFNHARGVCLVVRASAHDIENFAKLVCQEAPPLSVLHSLQIFKSQEKIASGFFIRGSQKDSAAQVYIPADVVLCSRCRQELNNPQDKRYRYSFINCINCGPRFTIVKSLPYDRPNTSIKNFSLCQNCWEEYEDPSDIRFHAQPSACPRCGPHIF